MYTKIIGVNATEKYMTMLSCLVIEESGLTVFGLIMGRSKIFLNNDPFKKVGLIKQKIDQTFEHVLCDANVKTIFNQHFVTMKLTQESTICGQFDLIDGLYVNYVSKGVIVKSKGHLSFILTVFVICLSIIQ